MVREYAPTDFIDIAAKFQQKTRESIQAWLVWLWVMGGDGISLTRKEAEKKSNITTYPAFWKCPMVTKVGNLSLLKAKWAHSLFHWQDHLVTVFVPSIGRGLLNTQRNPY